MKNPLIQLLAICAILTLTNCASNRPPSSTKNMTINFELSEDFVENIRKFQIKMKTVIDTIQSDEDFSNVSIEVGSEFDTAKEKSESCFVLLLHYAKAYQTGDQSLKTIGKQTLQKAISNLQNPSYNKYTIKFLKNSNPEVKENVVLQEYEFSADELVNVQLTSN